MVEKSIILLTQHKSSIISKDSQSSPSTLQILIRPHLKSWVKAGTSHFKKCGNLFKKTQGRAPKIIKMLEEMEHTQQNPGKTLSLV